MKILIEVNDVNAHYYINKGLANAFSFIGHEVYLWRRWEVPTFKVFDTFEPDMFIGNVHTIDNSIFKCIYNRPHLKVIMKGPDFGGLTEKIKDDYPILYLTNEYLSPLLKLREKTGKPDFVFVHYPEEYLERTHGYYSILDIPVLSLMNAADIIEYNSNRFDERLECQVSYIGGYWKYKSKNLDPYITSLCSNFKYRMKIFGNSQWPCSQYCGFLPEEKVKDLFISSEINLNIHEPHSQKYGFDIVERPFKVFACGGFLISDYVEGLKNILPDIPMGKTPEEYRKKIDYYLYKPDERKDITIRCQKEVLKNHTYFSRIKNVLDFFSIENNCEELLCQMS